MTISQSGTITGPPTGTAATRGAPASVRRWFPVALTAVLLATAVTAQNIVFCLMADQQSENLRTVAHAAATAVRMQLEAAGATTAVLAGNAHTQKLATGLYDIRHVDPPSDTGVQQRLMAAGQRRLLLEHLRIAGRSHGFSGVHVVGMDGTCLVSDNDKQIGNAASDAVRATADDAMTQRSVIVSRPVRLPDRPDSGYLLLMGAPLLHAESAEVIGALVLHLDTRSAFSSVLNALRSGDTGETYVFDAEGTMLSPSRFEPHLAAAGLPRAPATVRNPGGDTVNDDFRPETPPAGWPLTRAAASAVSGESGVDVDGYADYRGVKVVGAWTWLPDYQLGVVTEKDAAEAFAPQAIPRRMIVVVGVLLLAACLYLLLSERMREKLRRSLRNAMRENSQLGQYTLQEKIGEGGMGTVYRASHAMLRRPTAIKLLNADKASREAVMRFEREVQMTAQLTHPNTIAIYDYGRTPDDVFYYAMEFLPGVTLKELVLREGPQPPARVIHILLQICGSLAEAHAVGLIHRDIKPANVMLCERGGLYDVVKVLDFGLVKELIEPADENVTQANRLLGTPLYMAPEQMLKPDLVDSRSDLYSVAAVGYYLLTGKPAADGTSVMEVMSWHVANSTPPPFKERMDAANVPDDLENTLLRALSRDPADRPGTIRELADHLETLRDNTWCNRQAGEEWKRVCELFPRVNAPVESGDDLEDSRAGSGPADTGAADKAVFETINIDLGSRLRNLARHHQRRYSGTSADGHGILPAVAPPAPGGSDDTMTVN